MDRKEDKEAKKPPFGRTLFGTTILMDSIHLTVPLMVPKRAGAPPYQSQIKLSQSQEKLSWAWPKVNVYKNRENCSPVHVMSILVMKSREPVAASIFKDIRQLQVVARE